LNAHQLIVAEAKRIDSASLLRALFRANACHKSERRESGDAALRNSFSGQFQCCRRQKELKARNKYKVTFLNAPQYSALKPKLQLKLICKD
jgi:hypothetical protein